MELNAPDNGILFPCSRGVSIQYPVIFLHLLKHFHLNYLNHCCWFYVQRSPLKLLVFHHNLLWMFFVNIKKMEGYHILTRVCLFSWIFAKKNIIKIDDFFQNASIQCVWWEIVMMSVQFIENRHYLQHKLRGEMMNTEMTNRQKIHIMFSSLLVLWHPSMKSFHLVQI